MRIFISAGEPSGDHHAALLVEALRATRPDVECVGLGGPQMAAAGCRLVTDLTRLAVMWFLRVILSIHRFVDIARRAEREFLDRRPDVCVLVDFPGFHWWLAWRAKRHGIPVIFYCPPQIWAWASWRIGKMRRLVDHVLAALPFEHDWFIAQGMRSTLVGHPFFDELPSSPRSAEVETTVAPGPLVLLLPGSRSQEIEANLASMLRTARQVAAEVPEARFTIAALHDRHARRIRELLPMAVGLPVDLVVGRTRSLIAASTAAIAVSGSVSLELLAARVPAVIVYRISGLAYVVQSWFRHARFITLVNLLACREPVGPTRPVVLPPREVPPADPEAVYPEYLAVQDPASAAAGHLIGWLRDDASRRSVVGRLEAIAARVGQGGSAERAAAHVLAVAAGVCDRRSGGARVSPAAGRHAA